MSYDATELASRSIAAKTSASHRSDVGECGHSMASGWARSNAAPRAPLPSDAAPPWPLVITAGQHDVVTVRGVVTCDLKAEAEVPPITTTLRRSLIRVPSLENLREIVPVAREPVRVPRRRLRRLRLQPPHRPSPRSAKPCTQPTPAQATSPGSSR